MEEAKSFGEATKTVAFLNMNWNVVDATDIYKLCGDVVGCENIIEIIICKTKFGEKVNDLGSFKDKKEFKNKKLEIVKQSFVGIVYLINEDTAVKLYNELDSTELDNSGMFFDIRFVNDDIKHGEIVQKADSEEKFVEKDFNKFEMDEDRHRKALLERLFNSKNTDRKLINQLISISDNEDEEIEEKKKLLFEEMTACEEGEEAAEDEQQVDNELKEDNEQQVDGELQVDDDPNPFIFNHLDPRFLQLYTDDDFTIDPTHPEYKRNNKLKLIISEKRRRFDEVENFK